MTILLIFKQFPRVTYYFKFAICGFVVIPIIFSFVFPLTLYLNLQEYQVHCYIPSILIKTAFLDRLKSIYPLLFSLRKPVILAISIDSIDLFKELSCKY